MLAPNALTTIDAALTFLGLREQLLDNDTIQNVPVIDEEGNETIVEQIVLSKENQILHQQVAMAINRASAAIETFCRRKFAKQTHTQYIRKVTDDIATDQYPVLEHIPDDEHDNLMNLVEHIEYSAGIVYFKRPVKGTLTYVAGYVLPKDATDEEPRTLPHDLEHACLRVANDLYIDAADGYLNDVQNLKLGDWSTKLGDGANSDATSIIPSDLQETLMGYRKVLIDDE